MRPPSDGVHDPGPWPDSGELQRGRLGGGHSRRPCRHSGLPEAAFRDIEFLERFLGANGRAG